VSAAGAQVAVSVVGVFNGEMEVPALDVTEHESLAQFRTKLPALAPGLIVNEAHWASVYVSVAACAGAIPSGAAVRTTSATKPASAWLEARTIPATFIAVSSGISGKAALRPAGCADAAQETKVGRDAKT
jgi:hypothetical protein